VKQILRQLIVFLGVGLINTGTTLTVILALIYWFHLHQLFANFLGYALGIVVSFTLNRRLTFKDEEKRRRSAVLFLAAAAIAYGLNVVVILAAERGWGINLYLSQILGNIAYTLSFFLLCRWFVFPQKNLPSASSAGISIERLRQPLIEGWPTAEDIYAVLKAWVITGLMLWLMDIRGYNPLDDHQFARTILQDLPFGAYFNQTLGRFYPLVAQEYVLISFLLGHEEVLFYAVGTLKLAILGWILSLSISGVGLRGFNAFILWLSGLISFGVAGTVFRLHAGDLSALILLLGYLTLLQNTSDPQGEPAAPSSPRLWLSFLLAVLASLYKESIAVVLLCFSSTELLRLRVQNRWPEAQRHLPVFLYTLLYLIIYKLWVGHPGDDHYVLTHQIHRLTVILRFLESNPEIFCLTLPMLLIRIGTNGRNWAGYRRFDSMLLAALVYAGLFIGLGMFNQYYLLPGMAFSLIGIAGTLAAYPRIGTLVRAVPIIMGLILLENSPAIYSELSFQKQIILNHGRFLNFVARWSPDHCGNERPRCTILVEGVSQKNLPEVLISLDSFFDLLAPERWSISEASEGVDRDASPGFSWKYMNQLGHAGDYLLINPYREGTAFMETPTLSTVFDSGDHSALPRWRLDQWVRFCGWKSRIECQKTVRIYSRETGYRLLRKIRNSLPVQAGTPLRNARYELATGAFPSALRRSSAIQLSIHLKNIGQEAWLPDAPAINPIPVHLAYRWMDPSGHIVREGDRTSLPEAILPGESLNTLMTVIAPELPGLYRLEVGPVQEGVLWFPMTFTRDILID
jgi:putative flippase GtrA